jgi:hypothetical protein
MVGLRFRKSPTANEHPLLQIGVTNSGQTLGTITGWSSFLAVSKTEPIDPKPGELHATVLEAAPGGTAKIAVSADPLPTEELIHGLDDGTATFYFLGVLEYLDVFGDAHKTGFAFKTFKKPEGGGGFVNWSVKGARYWT